MCRKRIAWWTCSRSRLNPRIRTFEQMGDAMTYRRRNVAAAADADFEETAAALGLLANAGFQGEMGGTALRGAMSKLLNPTKAAQKILDKLGISAVTSTGRSQDRCMKSWVNSRKRAWTAGDAMKIFGQRAGPGMLALVSQGSNALVDLTGELKNAEGTAQKTADIMSGGLSGSYQKGSVHRRESALDQLWRTVEHQRLFWRANVFGDLPGPIQEVVVVVGFSGGRHGRAHADHAAVVRESRAASRPSWVNSPRCINLVRLKTIAMTVVQKAAAAAQWLINAAMTANPIGLVIAAIGLLVVAWVKWDDEIKAFLRGTWNLVKKGFYAFKGWVTEAFGVLKGWLDKIPTPILALMGPVGLVLATFKHWDDIPKIAKAAYEGIKAWLGDKLGAIFNGIKAKVWTAVVGFFGDMKDVIVGNSIVPDMVNEVDAEFQRLGTVMTYETEKATAAVTASLEGMTGKTEGWMSSFKDTMTGSLKSMLKGITGGEGISGMLTGIGKGVVDGIGNLVSGGLASLAGLALKGLVSLGKKLWGTIKGWFGRGKRKREQAAKEERERLASVALAAEEAAERMRAAAEKAAAEIKAYWDGVYNATISAFDQAKAAGVAAYDEIFLAAVESGLGQEEAVAKATAAQEAASAKILAAEGEKFARLAAFEAALEAIRSGNAAGAADAAALAAAQTRSRVGDRDGRGEGG